jgi:hypothetical protein
MFHYDACILTPRDHAILQEMLNREDGHSGPRADALRNKLRRSVIVEAGHIGPEIATLGSLVRFRIDGSAPEERVIVTDLDEADGRPALLAWTGRGLALLGLAVGRSRQHVSCDGSTETVTLEAVLDGPGVRRPAADTVSKMDGRVQRGGTVLLGPDSDDWGPPAA